MKPRSLFVDVSGSMSDTQVVMAMDKATIEYSIGDEIIAFDKASAMRISFKETIEYALGQKDIDKLRLKLFEKGIDYKWKSNGAERARLLASFGLEKICFSDGKLHQSDFMVFNKMVIIPEKGKL